MYRRPISTTLLSAGLAVCCTVAVQNIALAETQAGAELEAKGEDTLSPAPAGGRGMEPENSAGPERVPGGGRGLQGQGSGNVTGGSLDINSADKATLKADFGLNDSDASAVLRHREKHGPLQTADELASVEGLSTTARARLRNRLGSDSRP